MQNHISPHTTGLVLGAFLGLFHFTWAMLVALGLAQPLMDFILRLHMIKPFYTILPFNAMTALGLIIMTTAIGYASGYIIALFWNCQQKGKK